MKHPFSITIFGNVDECRTEAEVSIDGNLAVLVYESTAGWQTELPGGADLSADASELVNAIAEARSRLQTYANRRGLNPPIGLTRPGLAFWLMEKTDGTVMGKAVNGES